MIGLNNLCLWIYKDIINICYSKVKKNFSIKDFYYFLDSLEDCKIR